MQFTPGVLFLAVAAWSTDPQAFLALPVVAGLLFALGVLLLAGEFMTAQFTGLGLVGLILLALVCWGQYLAGASGWWGLALLALGLLLVALEILVIPGFGIAGVAGTAALCGGLFLLVSGGDRLTPADPGRGLTAVGVAMLGLVAGGAGLLAALPRLAARRGLVLQATVDQLPPSFALPVLGPDDDVRPLSLVGAVGEALVDLRPGGYARLDDGRIDVITRGEYIPRGARVQVIADEGYRRVVRQLAPEEHPLEL